MQLLYPYVFLISVFYILCQRYCKRDIETIYFSNMGMLKKASTNNKTKDILKYIILFLLLFSLSSPVVKKSLKLDDQKAYEIALLLDASGSMYEDDRFKITKEILKEFIKNRKNDKIALEVFADFSYIASPLTYDKNSILKLLEYIKIGVAGSRDTSLYEALYLSCDLFKKSDSKNRVVILLTDGLNTINTIPLQVALNRIKKYNIKVYTIGIGQKDSYNSKVLQTIAKQTGAEFFQTTTPKNLDKIYAKIDQLEKGKITTIKYTKIEYYYQYPLALAIFLMIILYFKNKKRSLLVSILFLLLALYRPTIQTDTKLKNSSSSKFVVAFDISYSMDAKDISPSRLKFANVKFNNMLDMLDKQKVAVVVFSDIPYLVSGFIDDYENLKYLVSNIDLNNINRDKTNILNLLKGVKSLYTTDEDEKVVLIFTDGMDSSSFTNEIEYAKKNHIKVYIYNVGTKQGAVIYKDNIVLKDKKGDIVITQINEKIKVLANETDGKYLKYSLDNSDMKKLLDDIEENSKIQNKTIEGIPNSYELYYIPLAIGLLFFI